MTRVLLVSVEPPWPAIHGGRIRTARIAEALGKHLDVVVAFPDDGRDVPPTPVRTVPLPWRPVSQLRTRLSVRPHVGGHQILPIRQRLRALNEELRPDVVYWSHSYLASWAREAFADLPQVVEFPNIESRRLRSLAAGASGPRRMLRRIEAVKGVRWEPAVAREAALCVALSPPDEKVIEGWGGDVRLVENGVDLHPYTPSPSSGHVLAIASYDYEPNVQAARRIVHDIWPRVTERLPDARLVIAGRNSEALVSEFSAAPGVSVLGTLPDVSDAYAGAAVSLAATATGGGSQLKLTEAFSRGRSVVMTGFSAAGLPGALRGADAYWVADGDAEFADAIVRAVREPADRHARELAAWRRCQSLGWDRMTAPLAQVLAALPSHDRSGAFS